MERLKKMNYCTFDEGNPPTYYSPGNRKVRGYKGSFGCRDKLTPNVRPTPAVIFWLLSFVCWYGSHGGREVVSPVYWRLLTSMLSYGDVNFMLV